MLLWDVKSGNRIATIQTFNRRKPEETVNPTYSVAFSHDGKTLAVGTLKGIKLWDVEGDKKAMGVDGPDASVWSVAFSPDGKTLVTAGSEKGITRPDYQIESTVRLWQCLPVKKANN